MPAEQPYLVIGLDDVKLLRLHHVQRQVQSLQPILPSTQTSERRLTQSTRTAYCHLRQALAALLSGLCQVVHGLQLLMMLHPPPVRDEEAKGCLQSSLLLGSRRHHQAGLRARGAKSAHALAIGLAARSTARQACPTPNHPSAQASSCTPSEYIAHRGKRRHTSPGTALPCSG